MRRDPPPEGPEVALCHSLDSRGMGEDRSLSLPLLLQTPCPKERSHEEGQEEQGCIGDEDELQGGRGARYLDPGWLESGGAVGGVAPELA